MSAFVKLKRDRWDLFSIKFSILFRTNKELIIDQNEQEIFLCGIVLNQNNASGYKYAS